ncbi:uncharacterized protein VTP21DRAFT_2243 [Calcarisporiella thermophila]|uniref:uncharacterized protein n=1 Tax=Calcarisporiella thermophila TaxID=911321 RepID=UPI0037434759
MASQRWTRLIRFLAPDGQVYHGQPILKSGHFPKDISGLKANVIVGDIYTDAKVTERVVQVEKLLAPIVPTIFRCIGLNYRKHAAETKMELPNYPILFIKPPSSIQGPNAPVMVPSIATNNQIDYEAELAVVIGRKARNVTREKALEYVLGYTCANDISARKWQGKKLGSGQWCFSKGFDTFCPLGPQLVSPHVIPDPNALAIRTRLNGRTMQDSNTSDMIFDVPHLISFLSQGTTLQPGDVIVTGTPEGVGFTREPALYMQEGDEVEVEIEKIGTLMNRIEFEREGGVIVQEKSRL